jgi:hypothetical protein
MRNLSPHDLSEGLLVEWSWVIRTPDGCMEYSLTLIYHTWKKQKRHPTPLDHVPH